MNSLSRRLLIWLTAIQVAAILGGMALFPLLAPFTSYNELAEVTARSRLTSSLVRSSEGHVDFQPSTGWKEYERARPGLQYAIADLDRQKVIASNADDLAEAARALMRYPPRDEGSLTTRRTARNGETMVVTSSGSALGNVLFVTAGNEFRADDIPSFFVAFAPAMLPIYVPIILGALIAVPMFIRRTLGPVNRLVVEAQSIDVRTPNARLSEAGIDPAFEPLIRSINSALDRLDSGFARQRLYAANAAHELRTPLAILKARLDSLPETPAKHQVQLDAVRIESLVEQLLSLARLAQSDFGRLEAIDLVAAARDVVADRAPLALRAGKGLAFEGPNKTVIVQANMRSLQSAIANLIDNALRAEPTDGTVEISVGDDGSVAVIDHGSGVDVTDRAAIFEPFWRKDEQANGSGLGLAIAKEVMALHGGFIGVDDTRGGGATFRLKFASTAG